MFSEKRQALFWEKVDRRGPDDCWMWTAFRNSQGYGRFWALGQNIQAHRYSLALKLGRTIPHPMMACHTCDNPGCVNPNHLWEGTRSENVRDAMQKGRMVPVPPTPDTYARGVRHHSAKLNPDIVRIIRSSTESGPILAKRYGVTRELISSVRRREIWKEVA
ncbi:HNH endonuclease [Sphingomonas sp. SAFR-052]|uniref:HNH endonuclease n=1 Tax=Sphingomonas sp. SAFR-052 TaxID=3436867 RepID=UPI003F804B5F